MTEANGSTRAEWLLGHLEWAVNAFGVQADGQPVQDQRLRAAGVRVLDHGNPAWLRVVFDDPEWGTGPYWDSNVTANAIQGVPKPTVLRWQEWDDHDRRFRGELSTYIPDKTLTHDMLLTSEVDL